MEAKTVEPKPYGVRHITDFPWFIPKGHSQNAISKKLVGPAEGSHKISYVISCYAPGHYAEPHKHQIREQVYHFLEGEGVLMIDGVKRRVGAGDIAYFPAGVEHGLSNESTSNLVFVIASAPAEEKS